MTFSISKMSRAFAVCAFLAGVVSSGAADATDEEAGRVPVTLLLTAKTGARATRFTRACYREFPEGVIVTACLSL
jgi:hypothetical protein